MPRKKEKVDPLFFAKARAKKAHQDGVMPFHEAMKGVVGKEKKPLVIVGTSYPGSDTFREIWAELSKKDEKWTTEEIKNEQENTNKKDRI